LDKKDLFGKSDPYFKIFRLREDEEAALVFESEIIKKTLDPVWKESVESIQKLCNSDLERPLRFEVWDWDRHSSHDLM
jgi:Ca2+-dependent lipid-binding protein